jgi:hypothetical protein
VGTLKQRLAATVQQLADAHAQVRAPGCRPPPLLACSRPRTLRRLTRARAHLSPTACRCFRFPSQVAYLTRALEAEGAEAAQLHRSLGAAEQQAQEAQKLAAARGAAAQAAAQAAQAAVPELDRLRRELEEARRGAAEALEAAQQRCASLVASFDAS